MAIDSGRDTTGTRVLSLVDIARGLEDEGQYNAAKIFRAAAEAEVVRATRAHPRQGIDLEPAMDAAVAAARDAGLNDELVDMLHQASSSVQAGHWPLLEEIPRTYVCRNCGHVIFGEAPNACPDCAARPLTFQEFPPIFYLDYLSPELLVAALESNLAEIERSVGGVSEDDASRGVWPMRDMMAHLLGAHKLLGGRALQMLEEDEPKLTSVPSTDVKETEELGVAETLQRFRDLRLNILERVRDLDNNQWQRGGYHPEWGRITVLAQLTYMARHEQHHLAELELRRNGG